MSQEIGKPYPRADGRAKVTGQARYSYEWPTSGVLYGVLVTSDIARGRILSVDTSDAEREPGVAAILTPFNAMKLPGGTKPADQGDRVVQALQDPEILYSAQPVAVAVADTFERALHAAMRVRVKAQPARFTVSMEKELPNAFPHDTRSSQGVQPADQKHGDVELGLSQATHRIDADYELPPEVHNPLEPHATLAVWNGDRLTVYDATQGITGVRKKLAAAFAVPPENVRVITKFVGGGFGCKGSAWSHVVIAALAAKQLGRPVKIALTRQQMFGPVGGRPQLKQQVSVGAGADGKLTAVRHTSINTTSQFDVFVEPAAKVSRYQYASPNIETRHRLIRLDIGTPTYMRAPGESSGSFALESAIDELAHEMGIDPIEFRLRNYAESDPSEGKPFSSKSLRRCYQMAAERFGWQKRPRKGPAPMRNGKLVGYGMATASYPANYGKASALARMDPDGSVLVTSGAVDLGTGTYTVMQQVAAETLGVPYEKVRFDLGDTDMPEAPRSGGSTTAASVASAVEAACSALKQKIDAAGGKVMQPIEAIGRVEPSPERKKYSLHSFGAQFAEVEVDPDLGMVRVVRMVGAYAAGRILNARLARSQFMGGMVWGIGMALHEQAEYDERLGRIMTRDLADYHVPTHKDVVVIDPIFIPLEEDGVVNPAGVKGIGEIGITGAAAAIANAVFDATGRRVRKLPITPDKLLLQTDLDRAVARP